MRLSLLIHKELHTMIRSCNTLADLRYFIEQSDVDNQFYLGEIYYHLGDKEVARWKWQSVADSDSRLKEWARKNIGDILQGEQSYEDALKYYQRLSQDDIQEEKFLQMARCYAGLQDQEQSAKYYLKVLQQDAFYRHIFIESVAFFDEHKMTFESFLAYLSRVDQAFDWQLFQEMQHYMYDDFPIDEAAFIQYMDVCKDHLPDGDAFAYIQAMCERLASYAQIMIYLASWLANHPTIAHFFITQLEPWLLSTAQKAYVREPGLHSNWLKQWVEQSEGTLLGSYLSRIIEASDTTIDVPETDRAQLVFMLCQDLHQDIIAWTSDFMLPVETETAFWMNYFIDAQTTNVMLSGTFNNGKTSFIQSQFGEKILQTDIVPTTSAVTILEKNSHVYYSKVQAGHGFIDLAYDDVVTSTTIEETYDTELYYIQTQAPEWHFDSIRLIDTPGTNDQGEEENPIFRFSQYADRLLYILSAEQAFRKDEKDMIEQLTQQRPDMPIDFILNKADFILDEDELDEVLEDTEKKVRKYTSPHSQVIPFSSEEKDFWQEDLAGFFESITGTVATDTRLRQWLDQSFYMMDRLHAQYAKVVQAMQQKVNRQRRTLNKYVQLKAFIEDTQESAKKKGQNLFQLTFNEWINELDQKLSDELDAIITNLSYQYDVNEMEQRVIQQLHTANWQPELLPSFVNTIELLKHRLIKMLQDHSSDDLNLSRLKVLPRLNATTQPIINKVQENGRSSSMPRIDLQRDDSWTNHVKKVIGGGSWMKKMEQDSYVHWLRTKGKEEIRSQIQQYYFRLLDQDALYVTMIQGVLDPEMDKVENDMQSHAQSLKTVSDQLKRLEQEQKQLLEGKGYKFYQTLTALHDITNEMGRS
ncbi:Dynamin family protein [Gracilibacillus halophilus YIM-C55.5]|uniref:Dynamin family protein n=1 Tax=Gracilibacillus halophilus YIM-C55.5 TaxID=1308866 RepID=N4WIJ6_9BACI|nr:dynamin family protein [Gracilibacillus halophilus]ENH95987.1 Dynamin family protein [Gracilibacillus halophilus YIM-C55.5]